MTVSVNSLGPSGTETYSSAQPQTHHPHLHHEGRAQNPLLALLQWILTGVHSTYSKVCSLWDIFHTTFLRDRGSLWIPHKTAPPQKCLSELHPTAGLLQLHKLSISLFMSVQLMYPSLSSVSYHSQSQAGPESLQAIPCVCAYKWHWPCMRSGSPHALTVFPWVTSAGRAPCSFHAG